MARTSISGGVVVVPSFYKHAPIITTTENPPVLNTWKTVLDTKQAGQLAMVEVYQENTEADPKNVEWEITIDGEIYTDTTALDNSVSSFFCRDRQNIALVNDGWFQCGVLTSDSLATQYAIGTLPYHSCKIRYRMTSVLGTAQILRTVVLYDTS